MDKYKRNIKNNTFIKYWGIGIGISAVSIMVLLLAFAVIMSLLEIGPKFASPISSVCSAIGSFTGALYFASKNKQKGILCGALNAAAIIVLIMVCGLIFDGAFSLISLLHTVIIMLASVIGGILGVNKTGKHKIV